MTKFTPPFNFPALKIIAFLNICAFCISASAADDANDPRAWAIAHSVDQTYFGYGDETVEGELIIQSADGSVSERKFVMTTLEVKDGGDLRSVMFLSPQSLKGFVSLNHSRITKPDQQWIYLPKLDRVRRIAGRDKTGSFAGSEFSYEDLSLIHI